jgi:hypothetical protein
MTNVPEIPAMPAIPEDPEAAARMAIDLNDAFRSRCALGALINAQPDDAQRHIDAIHTESLDRVARAAEALATMIRYTAQERAGQ